MARKRKAKAVSLSSVGSSIAADFDWKSALGGLIVGFVTANYGSSAGEYATSFFKMISAYFGG